jgi:hypothetical protein
MTLRGCFAGLAGVLFIVGAAQAQTPAPKNDYSKPETWLCRPGSQAGVPIARTLRDGVEDACAVDLSTSVITNQGQITRESFSPSPNPAIDCFYVYPTVSLDPGGNSDMVAGPEERNVIRAQFARFQSVCRAFAPLYRQFTLTALRAGAAGKPITADRTIGYNDVLDAWNHYLRNDNRGRGVVLIGHSQGSGVLSQLIRNEIDGKPIQSQIVSALLLGSNVAVPRGKDVGGAFKHMPLCRTDTQTGCIVTYVSFRSTIPPPADSRFGRVQGEGMEAGCTNPAALGGGGAELHAYLSTGTHRWLITPPGTSAVVDTPFVSVPGLLSARCVANEAGSYLEITVNTDTRDRRADDIPGDVMAAGKPNPTWGLHLIDVHAAMGNLVSLVNKQASAYTSTAKSR